MARHESDREDLMQEATAFRHRVELRAPAEADAVVVGFRPDGSPSIYFGQDAAYHFDAAGRLRRAFVDGRLYRTQGDTLAELTRRRTQDATELRRHDLSPAERDEFLETMRQRIGRLRRHLAEENVEMLRCVPGDVDWLSLLCDAICDVLQSEEPLAPQLSGKS